MKHATIAIYLLIIGGCTLAYADDTKAKGVETVPDTAVTVIKKTEAFFKGDLEWTMPPGDSKYKKDYTVNAMGVRVPRSTLKKYDSGVR